MSLEIQIAVIDSGLNESYWIEKIRNRFEVDEIMILLKNARCRKLVIFFMVQYVL